MATPQATPDSQPEESNSLELPSACDLRDYVLREPSQEPHSETISSAEAFSILSSSEVNPGKEQSLKQTNTKKENTKKTQKTLTYTEMQ